MNDIRRQSIISTIFTFIGFGVGLANSLLFTRQGWFSIEQYGLTRSFFDFGQVIFACSFLGTTAIIYKFSPYYKAHLKNEENDLLSWNILVSLVGFLIFLSLSIFFKDFFVRKFGAKSPLLVQYYYWIFPFGFFLLMFSLIESYCWSLKRTVISNFLKETALRLVTLILILLFIFKLINFDLFIKLFAFIYGLILLIIIIYLLKKNEFFISFKTSIVTRKFKKKMAVFGLFIFAGVAVSTVAATIDSVIISSLIGQTALGVFALSNYISALIQVPQRSIISISIPFLSQAWREKNYDLVNRIYKRSSINLLLLSLFIFGNIWLNFEDAIHVLKMNPAFLTGKSVALFIALKIIVDMGTGVNGQIIGTSNFWRFEFFTGVILLVIAAPLNYILIKKMGIVGAGISNLISYTIYNLIRILFLWKKFKMQPFSWKTLISIGLWGVCYFVIFFTTKNLHEWSGILIKTVSFSLSFIWGVWFLKLTPDFEPVLNTVKKRLGLKSDF